ncbi:hypothetical protein D3C85_1406290 [compost metagenome]
MPLSQGRQALLQGADRILIGVLGEVTHDAVASRRQKTTPSHFEVLHRSTVALPGVFPGTGLQVPISLVHLDPSTRNVIFPAMKIQKSAL